MNPTAILRLYTPHEVQRKFHQSKARYRVLTTGRQAGKSSALINELLAKAWMKPGGTFWFISPTYNQSIIQYRRMVSMLWPCSDILIKKNQTELRLKLVNQSQIVFKSGEVLDNLRGSTLDGVVIDEMRDQQPGLWTMVIRPMLATTGGWAAFASTSNGFDEHYDLHQKGVNGERDWESFQAPSTANPLFTKEEFEAAKRDMTEAQFAQEILAEFRDIHSGKAYLNFGQDNLRTDSPFCSPGQLVSPYLPVIVACDFNLSPMCWTLGQKKGSDFYWFDELYLKDSHTPAASLELVARLDMLRVSGLLRSIPQVVICGDATSKAGQRAAAGKSDYDIMHEALKAAGIKFRDETPDSNPAVKDRVNNVNAKLKSASGSIHMWVNPKTCPMLKKDLERVSWKSGSMAMLDKTKNADLTHGSDGVGYAVSSLDPIKGVSTVGGLRVRVR